MKEQEMWSLLAELKSTNYWPAVKSYVARAGQEANAVFRGFDPIKDPAHFIRNQGKLDGLEAFVSEVESEAEERAKRMEDA